MEINNIIQSINTPCYMIDLEKLQYNYKNIYESFNAAWNNNIILGYSVKTNHFPYMLKWAKENRMLAEVVSKDEYNYALENGFETEQIIFNGPCKSEGILLKALNGLSLVNIDNLYEIDMIKSHEKELNKNAKIGLRLNFDLEEECMNETTAGEEGNRFGICLENGDFEQAVKRLQQMHLQVKCIHLHYSTKTRSVKVFRELAKKVCEVCIKYNLVSEIEYIDIGGGFWGGRRLQGKPSMEEYSKVITEILYKTFTPEKVVLVLEPGASLVATAVDYYARVKNVRKVREKQIVTLDGSLLHINPFMQNREPCCEIFATGEDLITEQVICGSTCMEMDRFITVKQMKELCVNDCIKISNAGAYTMAFNNCFINYPPYIYLKKDNEIAELRNRNDIKMGWI